MFNTFRKARSAESDTVVGSASDALRQRYIRLLVDSLLNEIYLENEVRLFYIFSTVKTGKRVDTDTVRRIATRMPELVEAARAARQDGSIWWRVDVVRDGAITEIDLRNVCQFSHTMIGRKRLENIIKCLDTVRTEHISGDLIETGAWRGGACILMRGYLEAWNMTDRVVWAADSFEGLPRPTAPEDAGHDFSASEFPILAVSLDEVQENFRRYGLLDERVRFLKGWFRDTLPTAPIGQLALLRLDGDLYESTMDALTALYDKVVPGGFVIIDDYGDFEPCRRAVQQFRTEREIVEPIETIDWSGAFWRKA